MPLQKMFRAAVPFMAGGAVAIFMAELARGLTPQPAGPAFPDTWFREADTSPEHLWQGEPSFDWGD